MNKKILAILISCLSLCGCSNNGDDSMNATNQLSSETKENESTLSNEIESNSNTDAPEIAVVNFKSVSIAVNEAYNFRAMLKDEYIGIWMDLYVEDPSIAQCDVNDNIIGKKLGTTNVRIEAATEEGEVLIQTVSVHVVEESAVIESLTSLDLGRIKDKSIAIFGDSISDSSVTAYPDNRPAFYGEQLVDTYGVKTVYNYAKSGATIGYSISMGINNPIDGTYMIQKKEVTDDLKNSDYAILFFGANDFWRQVALGKKGEINDSNYNSKESFVGAYYYLIEAIKKANPSIRIVCLSTTYSTWGIGVDPNYKPANDVVFATSREELNENIQSVANDTNSLFVNIYSLWNATNYATYIPDGIHPQTIGYNLLVKKLLNL